MNPVSEQGHQLPVESKHIQLPGEIGRCGWAVNRLLFDDGGSDFTRL